MLFNLIPLVFVLAFMGVGSRKGFVRELMAFVGLCAALIITTGKLDFVAVEIADAINTSPLTTAIISFVLLLGLTWAIFKLIAKFIAKIIELQKLGQRDKYGGAIIGAVRGWLIIGTVLFLTVLLPMPRGYYTLLDQSMLATSALQSVQWLYDTTDPLHSEWPSFLAKVEGTLTDPAYKEIQKGKKTPKQKSVETRIKDELLLRKTLDKIYFYFGDGDGY